MFTANASAMCTNKDINTAITALNNLFQQYEDQISPEFPREFFLGVLKHIMYSNIFPFGNTFWLQLFEMAMGTPAAPL